MEVKRLIVGEIETNCYLLVSGNEMLVIDPGDEEEKIYKEILSSQARLKYIINTHYHFDHCLANSYLARVGRAEILIHENERSYIDFKPDRFLQEGETIEFGDSVLTVLLTPGHSAGSICLLADNMIFTGDTLFYGTYGRTDIPGGSETQMYKSFKRLEQIIKPGMMVYPGHGRVFEYSKDYIKEIIALLDA